MKAVIHLSGLDCANCALELEEKLKKISGVKCVSVNFVKQRINLECDDEIVVERVIDTASRFEDVKVIKNPKTTDKKAALKDYIVDIISIAVSLVVFIAAFIVPQKFKIVKYTLFAIAYAASSYSVLWQTIKNLSRGRIFDENFLMTLASIGAICLSEYAEAVEVMLLYRIGELLQSVVVGASRKSIADLMDLKSENASVLTADGHKSITPEEIEIGDVMLVKAGEKIAVDGIIVKGETSLDCKSLNGEAEYREVVEGDFVLGGSINAGGVIEVKAEKKYKDSAVAKILDLVENSTSKKSQSEKFITKFAKIYTPVVCLAAIIVAFVVPLFTGNNYADLGDWVYRSLVFLVISCPCALVISVPLSYFSGIGYAAKHGLLLKGSTALDALSKTKIIAFDKTGTLTYGNFYVSGVYPQKEGISEKYLLSLATAAENKSSHPIAEAFKNIESAVDAENVKELSGRGIICSVDGGELIVGNKKLMKEKGVKLSDVITFGTIIFVALNGEYLGYIEIEDKVKENAASVLSALEKSGVKKRVMLTGDNKSRAEKVAKSIGIDKAYCELLPDEKLKIAQELKKDGALCYVGDGINDAPVLIEADTGISMGGVGSDAAIEASDAVLICDDLSVLPLSLKIAAKTRRIVIENIVFSIAIKIALMVLGLFDIVPLYIAVLADVGVMMLAVLNSFRTRTGYKENGGNNKAKYEQSCECEHCKIENEFKNLDCENDCNAHNHKGEQTCDCRSLKHEDEQTCECEHCCNHTNKSNE